MAQTEFSFKAQMWKRLKKNRGAMFGLIIIVLAVLISIFGYLIAPDNSPNADLQTVEIQAKKPGYEQQFLKIPGNKNTEGDLLNHFISGRKNDFQIHKQIFELFL